VRQKIQATRNARTSSAGPSRQPQGAVKPEESEPREVEPNRRTEGTVKEPEKRGTNQREP